MQQLKLTYVIVRSKVNAEWIPNPATCRIFMTNATPHCSRVARVWYLLSVRYATLVGRITDNVSKPH
jgi:hypothetical protein